MYNVKWRTYSNINYETIVILCNWVDGLKNVSPSHKFYLLALFKKETIAFAIIICIFSFSNIKFPISSTAPSA